MMNCQCALQPWKAKLGQYPDNWDSARTLETADLIMHSGAGSQTDEAEYQDPLGYWNMVAESHLNFNLTLILRHTQVTCLNSHIVATMAFRIAKFSSTWTCSIARNEARLFPTRENASLQVVCLILRLICRISSLCIRTYKPKSPFKAGSAWIKAPFVTANALAWMVQLRFQAQVITQALNSRDYLLGCSESQSRLLPRFKGLPTASITDPQGICYGT